MEYATLQNGLKMPMEGFGVFQARDKEECKRSVLDAIRTGYRLIDTAASYTNEDAVGEAVREAIAEGICTREELFITSKMWVQDMQNYEMAKAAIGASLEKTGLEYLDLYLLHQAMKDYFSAWRAMEELYAEGKVRAIGVDNFTQDRLADFLFWNKVKPAVNLLECNTFFQRENERTYLEREGIQMQAWSPLAAGQGKLFENETLCAIANAHSKSVAQVVLRWLVQRNIVPLVKSANPQRMKENLDIFDFALTDAEIQQIAALDTGHSCFGSRDTAEKVHAFLDAACSYQV